MVATGYTGTQGPSSSIAISEDGSTVYYNASEKLYRYETEGGQTSFVAAFHTPKTFGEPSFTTPNGEYLVFVSEAVEVPGPHGLPELVYEPRGEGHNELYRYDATDGSVMCVSCGEGVAPDEGNMLEPTAVDGAHAILLTDNETPSFVQMSENGQEVFFETTAQLVPQDTNSPMEVESSTSGTPGMDVYEWEADGSGDCRLSQGCTYLLSSGEEVGPAKFLGASKNGENVFFATAAQLLPQATPEFTNIYDARVDGGFPQQAPPLPCLSCHGVGAPPPPLLGPGATLTATSTGNLTNSVRIHCAKGRRLSHSKCVKVKSPPQDQGEEEREG